MDKNKSQFSVGELKKAIRCIKPLTSEQVLTYMIIQVNNNVDFYKQLIRNKTNV